MKKYLLASVIALAMTGGIALAQNTSSETQLTQTTPAIVAPPVGTLSTTRTERSVDALGQQTSTTETTYRNAAGVADDRKTTTTTTIAPAALPATTTFTKSTTSTTTTN